MKIVDKIKNHKKITALIVLLLAGILVGAYAFGLFDKKVEKPESQPVYRSQLTGVETEQSLAQRPVLGVMIENSEEARPQTGLDAAGIVFETVAEGGITRYLALYQENQPAEVGPVRSIRAYYLDWAMGFEASIAHVGGSADALALEKERNARSLNQFEYPEPYYRVNNRAAPHNMYARTQGLRELQQELGYDKSNFIEIPRSDDNASQAPDATNIAINFSGPLYKAEFKYDQPTNSYTRYLAGKPHLDAVTGQPITVKNLVVLKMPTPEITALSEGEALIFKNGTVQIGKWAQSSYKDRVVITDETGNEISLNRGDSWFAGLPGGKTVTY